MRLRLIAIIVILVTAQACASLPLGRLVQPPHFEAAAEQPGEVRLLGPRPGEPLGGAAIRVWTRVRNPNPFGLTLSTVRATLFLEEARAADGDFPLGLPLQAGQESVVPFDLTISFADVPGLAATLRRVTTRQPVRYRLDGTVGVDVKRLGTPTFGPMTLFSGELRTPAGF